MDSTSTAPLYHNYFNMMDDSEEEYIDNVEEEGVEYDDADAEEEEGEINDKERFMVLNDMNSLSMNNIIDGENNAVWNLL